MYVHARPEEHTNSLSSTYIQTLYLLNVWSNKNDGEGTTWWDLTLAWLCVCVCMRNVRQLDRCAAVFFIRNPKVHHVKVKGLMLEYRLNSKRKAKATVSLSNDNTSL